MIRAAGVPSRARAKSDFGTGAQLAQLAAFVAFEVDRLQRLGDKRDHHEIATMVLADIRMPKFGDAVYRLRRRAIARAASLARAAIR